MFLHWVPSDSDCMCVALFVHNLFRTTWLLFSPTWALSLDTGKSSLYRLTSVQTTTASSPGRLHDSALGFDNPLKSSQVPTTTTTWTPTWLHNRALPFTSLGRRKMRAVWQPDAIWIGIVVVVLFSNSSWLWCRNTIDVCLFILLSVLLNLCILVLCRLYSFV